MAVMYSLIIQACHYVMATVLLSNPDDTVLHPSAASNWSWISFTAVNNQ